MVTQSVLLAITHRIRSQRDGSHFILAWLKSSTVNFILIIIKFENFINFITENILNVIQRFHNKGSDNRIN